MLQKIRSERFINMATPIAVFIVSNIYLFGFGRHLFFYQENQSLFIFTGDYLSPFLSRPGGLLEYASYFLTQGYYSAVYGSLLLSLVMALFTMVFLNLNTKLSADRISSVFLAIVPPCLLLLMHINFNWPLTYDLGFLLAAVYLSLSVKSGKKGRIILLALFPLFYYATGLFAWLYLGMYLVYSVRFDRGWLQYSAFILVLVTLVMVILSRRLIFLQPDSVLLMSPYSVNDHFTQPVIMYLLCGYMILFPLLVSFSLYHSTLNDDSRLTLSSMSLLTAVIITLSLMFRLSNPNIAQLFKLEKAVYGNDWDTVIRDQERWQLPNLIAEFYYNLALSEKGLLCERMFHGRQDFGPGSLIIPWDSKMGVNNIARGVYFFYNVGLINEAHRWAFESMVARGYLPENLKMLIKTDLINGHYRTAEKNIRLLRKTLHYRGLAKRYEAMLNRPDLVRADPELGEKIRIMPKTDFSISIRNPQTNLPMLLEANPANKPAFEYQMAWSLLEKNIDSVAAQAPGMENLNYSKIPAHIEEALIIYNLGAGMMPHLGDLKISDETVRRFRKYELTAMPQGGFQTSLKSKNSAAGKNTFWRYLDSK